MTNNADDAAEPVREADAPATAVTEAKPADGPPSAAEQEPTRAAAPAPRRTLKVVLNLQPLPAPASPPDAAAAADTAEFRAVLGVGAEGCDPVFRSLRVDGLAGALDEVPALAAEAEEKWQAQPRNPRLTPTPAAKTAKAGKAAPQANVEGKPPKTAAPRLSGGTQATPPNAATAAPATKPPTAATAATEPAGKGAKAAPAGQLSLFG